MQLAGKDNGEGACVQITQPHAASQPTKSATESHLGVIKHPACLRDLIVFTGADSWWSIGCLALGGGDHCLRDPAPCVTLTPVHGTPSNTRWLGRRATRNGRKSGPSVDASPSLGLVRSLLTALFCQDYNNLVQVGIERLDEEKNQISPLLEVQRSRLTDLRAQSKPFSRRPVDEFTFQGCK
jgi:hypothetical protein